MRVSVTRVEPEIFVPPRPGEAVRRAHGAERDRALFFDAMTRRLPVGLSRGGEPIYANLDFLDGQRGAHVNISGVSGVATKTSYAMFLLYSLFGSGVLGHETANTRALVFNVKGEDLLFLDKPNAGLPEGDRARYAELGLEAAPFPSLSFFAPAARGDQPIPQTGSRMDGVTGFYWTLREFCAERYLRFLFADADDKRSQLGFVVQRVESELAMAAKLSLPLDAPTVENRRRAGHGLRRARRRDRAHDGPGRRRGLGRPCRPRYGPRFHAAAGGGQAARRAADPRTRLGGCGQGTASTRARPRSRWSTSTASTIARSASSSA